ncbi:MAG TPA: DUF3592 domain-containing protein [Rhodanobacteraceae bacterium]
MKAVAIVRVVMLVVGVAMLAGAVYMYNDARGFLADAVHAQGTVVDLQRTESLSHDDNHTYTSVSYYPMVQFTDASGKRIEFTSGSGSNPPAYSRGDQVDVLYHADAPEKARINSFMSLWFGPLLVGGLGVVFTAIGIAMVVVPIRRRRLESFLKANGVPVEATFESVERNTSVKVNGESPWRVLAQWLDPATSKVHVFKSDDLWFDPTAYIKDRKINVFINRGNPKKYYVDLSFLPKMAD